MKKFLHRLKKSKRIQSAFASLLLLYIRAVFVTIRWKIDIDPATRDLIGKNQPLLFPFWHGRLMMMAPLWAKFVRHTGLSMLVSGHTDGDFAGKTLAYYNIGFLRGSSSRGALAGAKAVMRSLNKGQSVAITVDGPRGPRMRMASGISKMARISGVPVAPACYSTSRGINAGSWDAMLIPFPFCRGYVRIDAPMHAEKGREDALDSALQSLLVSQQKDCDRKMGRTEIRPGPASEALVKRNLT